MNLLLMNYSCKLKITIFKLLHRIRIITWFTNAYDIVSKLVLIVYDNNMYNVGYIMYEII